MRSGSGVLACKTPGLPERSSASSEASSNFAKGMLREMVGSRNCGTFCSFLEGAGECLGPNCACDAQDIASQRQVPVLKNRFIAMNAIKETMILVYSLLE